MPIKERINVIDRVRQWTDTIPLHYEYTAGVAGEKFLRSLKQGRLTGGRCEACGLTFLPPRIYCLKCFERVERFVNIPPAGKIVGVSGRAEQGGARFAYVTFDGVLGGLILRSNGWVPKIGGRVRVRFKTKGTRSGSILDIEGFVPA